jgi:hypothetical protein
VIAPTLVVSLSNPTEGVKCGHGLADGRYLIPWSKWSAGDVTLAKAGVGTELCQVCPEPGRGVYPEIPQMVCRSLHTLLPKNTSDQSRDVSLYVALRPVGRAAADLNGAKQEKLLCPNAAGAFSGDQPSLIGTLTLPTVGLHYCILERWATELPDIQYVYHRLSAGRITQS